MSGEQIFYTIGGIMLSQLIFAVLDGKTPRGYSYSSPEEVRNKMKQLLSESSASSKGIALSAAVIELYALRTVKVKRPATRYDTNLVLSQYLRRFSKHIYYLGSQHTYKVVVEYVEKLSDQETVEFIDAMVDKGVLSNEEFYSGTF